MSKKNMQIKLNDLLTYVSIFIAFICATNGELSATKNTIIYYLPYVCCLAALILEILAAKDLKIPSYIIWRLAILFLFVFTFIYATSYDSVFFAVKKYLLQTIVVLLICVKCTSRQNNIKNVLLLCISAILINMVYALATVDITSLAEGERLGATALNESWNANGIGLSASMGMIILFLLCNFNDCFNTGFKKFMFYCGEAFLCIAMLLSGSRKSIIMLLSVILIYTMFRVRKSRAIGFILAAIALFAAVYALKNVDFLYNMVGYRFDSFLSMLFESGEGDNSAVLRSDMIDVGFDAFFEKPLLGYGINCFKNIYGDTTGWEVYAHNNYIELLVDVGLVGFFIYYGYIATMLFKDCGKNNVSVYLKAILVSMLITDFGLVSYYNELYQYILVLIFCMITSTQIVKSKTKR